MASLRQGDTEQVGALVSVDEQDEATVVFPGPPGTTTLPLDRLCKVASSTTSPSPPTSPC